MRPSIPVLCYHAIDGSDDPRCGLGHPRALFERHLDLISARGFVTISASHLIDICLGIRPLDGKYLALTFDDAHVSQWVHAVPLLSARGMTATFFAVTDLIGRGNPRTTDDVTPLDLSTSFRMAFAEGDRSQFMNEAELRSLVRDLGMEVHSHSSGHQGCFRSLERAGDFASRAHWSAWGVYGDPRPDDPVFKRGSAYAYNGYWPQRQERGVEFRRRSDDERYRFCVAELARSRERMAAVNGAVHQFLCWPWGEYDSLAERACREAGFDGAFTLDRGFVGPGTDPFGVNRIRVGNRRSVTWLAGTLALHATAVGASLSSRRRARKPEVGRVLFVTDSTKLSGGSRQLVDSAAALTRMGVAVEVLAPPASPLARALDLQETTLTPWPEPRRILSSARLMATLCRERRVDVVHTFHARPMKVAVLARLLGGRFRLFLNRGVIYSPNLLMPLFALVADGVICNSHACARLLRHRGVPGSRLHVVYNAVVTSPSPRSTAPHERPRILYVGNTNPVKGFDLFVELARRYRQRYPQSDVVFACCGVASALPTTAQGANGPHGIEMLGPVERGVVLSELDRAAVYVQTSRKESLSNALLEALGHQVPVLCSDVGGTREVVHDGVNGRLVASEDVGQMVERLHEMVEQPDRCRAMGDAGHQLTSMLTDTRRARCLVQVYSGDTVPDEIDWPAIIPLSR